MANLKDLIVNGASRFIGKVYINSSTIGTINNSTVGDYPKFTDTTYTDATTSAHGLLTAADKIKLDNLSTSYIALAKNMTNIAANTDLNSITTPGNYKCTNTATGQSLVNSPIATWFTMRVGYADGASDSWEYQQIIKGNDGRRYYRQHNGGTWTAWVEYGPNTDNNTTYSISMSGNVITLTGSAGAASSVTLPVYNGEAELGGK